MRYLLPLLPLAVAVGCSNTPANPDGPLRVVATTGMIADAVRQVGGAHVEVVCLMGPGVDPHRYAPRPSDSRAIAAAKVVFHNGLHLEGQFGEILGRDTGVAVSKDIPEGKLRKGDDTGTAHDPHVWFDVALWRTCVATVRDALAERDPAHAAEFRANADKYLAELAALDAEVRSAIGKLPAERRLLVTSHDAFGYFGAAYGLEVHGLQGISTASETGTQDVQKLAKFLGEKKVPAVFTESSVPPKGLQAVLDVVTRDFQFTPKLVGDADALYSDALGPPGSDGDTYVGMVRHNVRVITAGLGR